MKEILMGIMSFLLVGCSSVHNEIIIDASPSEVWSVLTNAKSYSQWNPVLLDLKGEFKEGETVSFKFHESEKKQYEVKAKVKKVIPNKLLNQKGGIWGIMTYNHRYILEPLEDKTKVTIHEDYRGAYVPFWDHKPLEIAYKKLNLALKKRVHDLKKEE